MNVERKPDSPQSDVPGDSKEGHVERLLLKACAVWDESGSGRLEETPELQDWVNAHPRNRFVVRVFEKLIRRERARYKQDMDAE